MEGFFLSGRQTGSHKGCYPFLKSGRFPNGRFPWRCSHTHELHLYAQTDKPDITDPLPYQLWDSCLAFLMMDG